MSTPRVRLGVPFLRVLVRRILLAASVALTVGIVWLLLWSSGRGLDLTDESYYLHWIANPGQYPASATQFGFVYHPLYVLVSGDVALLRQINILLTFALAWAAGELVLRRVLALDLVPRNRASNLAVSISAAALACTSLLGFHVNLVTPSYNSLTVQGALVVLIGVLLVTSTEARESLFGAVLIGAGGWAVFMGKPTAALAVGLLVLGYLAVTGLLRSRQLLAAVATALGLLLLSALAIDGSVRGFVERLTQGAEQLRLLEAGHGLGAAFRWDELLHVPHSMALLLLIAVGAMLLTLASRWRTWPAAVMVALAVVAGIGVFLLDRHNPWMLDAREPYRKPLLLAFPLAAVAAVIIAQGPRGFARLGRTRSALLVVLAVLPFAAAFGTNLNYWQHGGMLAICWLFAGIVLLMPVAGRSTTVAVVVPFAIASQVLSASLIVPALERPYRQAEALWEQSARVEVGREDAPLLVMDEAGRFIDETRAIFDRFGLSDGHPVIDLTGQSPGAIYVGGALAVDHPWVLGGYDGSADHERAALRRLPCAELAVTWVLAEPRGRRTISPDVLQEFGATLDDYALVAEWPAPNIGRKGADTGRETLALMQPIRTPAEAEAACEATRGDNR